MEEVALLKFLDLLLGDVVGLLQQLLDVDALFVAKHRTQRGLGFLIGDRRDVVLPLEIRCDLARSDEIEDPLDGRAAREEVGAERIDDLGRAHHALLVVRDDFHDPLVR